MPENRTSIPSPAPTPKARVQPVGRSAWVWAIPAAAVVLAIGLIATYVVKHGPLITVSMRHGHGVKPNDLLRCRGIVVGEVESVRLAEDFNGVEIGIRLDPAARGVARAGSRFWVQRPRVRLSGIGGLETIAGPRYLAVVPGEGTRQKRFVAVEEPPAVEAIDPQGLEITLVAERRSSLRMGAPVMYRQVAIGTVLSVGLSSDAASVEVSIYIQPEYAELVRDNSRFWNVSGVDMNFGLQGFRLGIESLQALVDGGVAVATPQRPGGRVSTGHMFKLAARAEEEWLGWRPQLAVGGKLLPPGGTPPRMLRVTVARVVGRVFSSQVQEKGWVLATGSDVIGPKSLLAPKRQKNDQATLQVAGKRISLDQLTVRSVGELVQVKLSLDAPAPAEPPRRSMSQVEDCVVWTTSGSGTLPLDAARLLPSGDNAFLVERSVAFDQTLQGAAVLARRDGALVGILLVEKGSGRIVALPPRTGP